MGLTMLLGEWPFMPSLPSKLMADIVDSLRPQREGCGVTGVSSLTLPLLGPLGEWLMDELSDAKELKFVMRGVKPARLLMASAVVRPVPFSSTGDDVSNTLAR